MKKSKSTTGPSKQALPHLNAATSALTSTFNANQPQLQAIAGDVQSRLPGLGEKAFGQNQFLDQAKGYASDVMGGKFLNSNPYIDQMAQTTRGHVANDANSTFSRAGRVGSEAHGYGLSRGMGEAELGLRYGAYGDERTAQQAAAGMAPGLVQAEFAGVNPYLQTAAAGAEIPFIGSNNYARGIGGLWGNSQTSTNSPGLGASLLGLGGAVAGGWAAGGFR